MSVLIGLAGAFVIGYLPGALVYRLPVLGWPVTAQGLGSAAYLITRVETAATLALLLILCTPWTHVLKAMRVLRVPPECDPGHVYHLFPVLTDHRDQFQAHLAARGIGTLVHYPTPLPRQGAFASSANANCPVTDRVAREVCSLPLHPQLSDADLSAVADAVQAFRPA